MRGRRACEAVIALGGNVGDVPSAFLRALGLLDGPATRVTVVSRLYHSVALTLPSRRAVAAMNMSTGSAPAPVGHYTNAVIGVRTRLGPRQLLLRLQQIERSLGRQRGVQWGPRTIDLDLICYEQKIMQTRKLTLPHKGLAFRAFVLAPAQDIGVTDPWPHLPITVSELLQAASDDALGLLHRRLSWPAR